MPLLLQFLRQPYQFQPLLPYQVLRQLTSQQQPCPYQPCPWHQVLHTAFRHNREPLHSLQVPSDLRSVHYRRLLQLRLQLCSRLSIQYHRLHQSSPLHRQLADWNISARLQSVLCNLIQVPSDHLFSELHMLFLLRL